MTIIDVDNDKQLLAIQDGNLVISGRCGLQAYSPVSLSQWSYLAWTITGDSYVLYINGQKIGSGNSCSAGIDADFLMIGSGYGGNEFFKGSIDDVKIYNRALSAGEIESRYKKDSLIGYWKFDDEGVSTTTDSSGNGNDGTLTNMDGANDYVEGQVGKGLEFDGVNDQVSAGGINSQLSGNDKMSTFAWVKRTGDLSSKNGPTIVDVFSGAGSRQFKLDFLGNAISAIINNESDISVATTDTEDLALNQWYFVGMTYDNQNISLYKNGQLINSVSQSGSLKTVNQDLHIGWYDRGFGDSWLKGDIDEVSIHSRALSNTEIRQAYETTRPRFEVQQTENGLSDYKVPEKIEQKILAKTVNDVFIYDAKKDSVNENWKNDNTKSWYLESSSATRCPNGYQETGLQKCTRNFPEVAIIVASDLHVYIYDAESNELWMDFENGDFQMNSGINIATNSVFALN